jgi:glycine C-acetyltransferase
MVYNSDIFQRQLEEIREQGLLKAERIITSAQSVDINTTTQQHVLNFCANNYLGLANHPDIIKAAQEALHTHGYGMASVRFICGTQDLHKALEQKIASFLNKEDAILYSSCFDANTGLFETLLGPEDAIISDALNHASIIDGVRLCKAQRHRYNHSDMVELEAKLQATQACRLRMIATDGVFSMDGDIAKLDQIVALAEKYNALVMVDESHATGVIGETGRGSVEYHHVMDKVDIITSTLGKALGGGSGGFTSASSTIVELLRQRSRPYLFSNTVVPALAAGGIKALDLISQNSEFRERLLDNTRYFRSNISNAGFNIKEGEHPIAPIMLYEAKLAQEMAGELLTRGIYVIGFSYPVVPQGQARIRVQMSAAHTKEQLDKAIAAFASVGAKLGVI